MAEPVEDALVERRVEEDRPNAIVRDADDFGGDALIESDAASGAGASARFCESEPAAPPLSDAPQEEDLDESVLGVAPVEPRRTDAHVVADEDIARTEQLGQIREAAVCDGSGAPIEDEQAARPAGPRVLGDALGGQVVIEGVDAHGRKGMSPEVTDRVPPDRVAFGRAPPGAEPSGLYAGAALLVRRLQFSGAVEKTP
jgi:hypothetical protein